MLRLIKRAADEAQQQHQTDRPRQRRREQLLGQIALVHILRDQKLEAAGELEQAAARAAALQVAFDAALVVELDEAAWR